MKVRRRRNFLIPVSGFDVIYIPAKEMISTIEPFAALYEEYHIDFEEMYYDLARLLNRPLSKGPNINEQNEVLKNFDKNFELLQNNMKKPLFIDNDCTKVILK